MRILAVVGNPKRGSRTLTVASAVATKLKESLAESVPTTEIIDLADHTGELLRTDSDTVEDLVASMLAADVLVVGSPTYKATYTGLLKVFLDKVAGRALSGKLAVPVMVAGAPQHALAVETYLRPLLVELGATCPTPGLCVLESELEELHSVIDSWWSSVSPSLRCLAITPD